MGKAKRNVRDSVFVNIFRDKKYLVELYRSLHPEDDVSEDDLEIISIENTLSDGIYNDLGFMVGNRLIVLVEAQTTWSANIIVRMFLYLARTYHDLIYSNKEFRINLYNSNKMELPEPELYVIFAGDKGDKKDVLSLKDVVFPGSEVIDLKAKLIYADENRRDIIGQYMAFCAILKEQIHLYGGDMRAAIQETIRICIAEDNLSEYLAYHRKEVEDNMFNLLDQKTIVTDRIDNAREEGEAKGKAEGMAEGKLAKAIQIAKKMLARNHSSLEEIAELTELPIQEIQKLAEGM